MNDIVHIVNDILGVTSYAGFCMPRPKVKSRKSAAAGSAREPSDIRDLFSFQLQRLAGLSTRIATLSIRPKFDITSREWRALAVLGYLKQAPLQELARHSGILKSQMSRTVAVLIGRGLIQRATNPGDGRSILLSLSSKGMKISNQILSESYVRNDHMLALLSAKERRLLSELVARVFKASFEHYNKIKKSAPPMNSGDPRDE
jgi:DNA-binding MarR family transcriptional regulator